VLRGDTLMRGAHTPAALPAGGCGAAPPAATAAGPAAQAEVLHGGLDRDGVHDAEQRLAQRQKLQLAARAFAEISGKAGIRHGNDGLRRDVRHHGDHATAAERHDRGRLVVVAAPNR